MCFKGRFFFVLVPAASAATDSKLSDDDVRHFFEQNAGPVVSVHLLQRDPQTSPHCPPPPPCSIALLLAPA